jgi:hypothetical protein
MEVGNYPEKTLIQGAIAIDSQYRMHLRVSRTINIEKGTTVSPEKGRVGRRGPFLNVLTQNFLTVSHRHSPPP